MWFRKEVYCRYRPLMRVPVNTETRRQQHSNDNNAPTTKASNDSKSEAVEVIPRHIPIVIAWWFATEHTGNNRTSFICHCDPWEPYRLNCREDLLAWDGEEYPSRYPGYTTLATHSSHQLWFTYQSHHITSKRHAKIMLSRAGIHYPSAPISQLAHY